jgi:hypothetical protein
MNDTEDFEIVDNVDEYADAALDLGCGDDNPYQK